MIRMFGHEMTKDQLEEAFAKEKRLADLLDVDLLPRGHFTAEATNEGKRSSSKSSPTETTDPERDPNKLSDKEELVARQAVQELDLEPEEVSMIQQERRRAKGAAYDDISELVRWNDSPAWFLAPLTKTWADPRGHGLP